MARSVLEEHGMGIALLAHMAVAQLAQNAVESEIEARIEALRPRISAALEGHPGEGALIVVATQVRDPLWNPEQMNTVIPDLISVTWTVGGSTRREAIAMFEGVPRISAGPSPRMVLQGNRYLWIPPLR